MNMDTLTAILYRFVNSPNTPLCYVKETEMHYHIICVVLIAKIYTLQQQCATLIRFRYTAII